MLYNKQIFERTFIYSKRYWYENIKQIPLYFKRIFSLIKYGYDEYAVWEIRSWFPVTMRSILERYRKCRCGVPILIDNYPMDSCANDEESKRLRLQNKEMWEHVINRMIELLELMDEDNPRYDGVDGWKKQEEEMDAAKEEFFKLFSEHFWRLWD